MEIIEFRKEISTMQSVQATDKEGNPYTRRYQKAAYDQGDGFPILVKFPLYENQEAYALGKYTWKNAPIMVKRDFDGDQVLALTERLPRLVLISESAK